MKIDFEIDAEAISTSPNTDCIHVEVNGVDLDELLSNFELREILSCFSFEEIQIELGYFGNSDDDIEEEEEED